MGRVYGNFLLVVGVRINKVLKFYPNFLGNISELSPYAPFDSQLASQLASQSGSALTFFKNFKQVITESKFPEDSEKRTIHLISLYMKSAGGSYYKNEGLIAEIAYEFQRLSDSFLSASGDSPLLDPTLSLAQVVKVLAESWKKQIYSRAVIMTHTFLYFGAVEIAGLRPFISQDGSIGLAPLSTEPGDEVWLIPTCTFPIILRRNEGKYVVLGRAHLGKKDSWSILGQQRDFLTEGETIAGYTVEAICLK